MNDLIFLLALIVVMKIAAKIVKMRMMSDIIVDIADRWGYIGHVITGYIAAMLMPQWLAGLMVAVMFAFYEVMHYIFPDSRRAIIEFMIAYTSTLIYLYKLPIKI